MTNTITVKDAFNNTQLINVIPATGPNVVANSLPVVMASDHPGINVTQGSGNSSNSWYTTIIGSSGNQASIDSSGRISVNPTATAALSYTATNITITANQAAGIDPIIAANPSRHAIQLCGPSDFQIAFSASQTAGMRIYASMRDSFIGAECPLNAIYLVSGSGLVAGNILTVWEA